MLGAHCGPVMGVGAGVGHDQQRAAVLGRAGAIASATPECTVPTMNVDVVALDQLVDVVGGLAGVALVVDLEVLDRAPAELAALLVRRTA